MKPIVNASGRNNKERGASLVEYCVLISISAMLAFVSIRSLGRTVECSFNKELFAMSAWTATLPDGTYADGCFYVTGPTGVLTYCFDTSEQDLYGFIQSLSCANSDNQDLFRLLLGYTDGTHT